MSKTIDEKPVPIAEIQKLHPEIPPRTVIRFANEHCESVDRIRRGGRLWVLSQFEAALKMDRKNRCAIDCHKFTDRQGTWVAKKELPGRIRPWTADKIYADGLSRAPRDIPLERKAGHRASRRFWHLEDIKPHVDAYATPKVSRDRIRTLAELDRLPDHEFVNRGEARLLGFKANWLTAHSDIPHPQRRRTPSPAPNGRPIHGEKRTRIAIGDKFSYRRNDDPWYRIGDLRECIRMRDNPQVPAGGRLIRPSLIAELAREGIRTNRTKLAKMIRSGVIGGGRVTAYAKNFAKKPDSWWMKWEDRTRIPAPRAQSRRGGRLCWISGEDWYPLYGEARKVAGMADATATRLKSWVSHEYGGAGKRCPYLGGRLIRCARGKIAHAKGDDMIVCAGEDLRTIAEALTGVRPKAPPKPPGMQITPVATVTPATDEPRQKKREGGRPPVSAKEEKRRLDILDGWFQRAKGTQSHKEYCRDRNITTTTFWAWRSWQLGRA